MDTFKVGFSRVNINPPLGIGVHGYYKPRFASGFIDDLTVSTIALGYGETRVLLVSIDLCELPTWLCGEYRAAIAERTGVPAENIFLSCTHTHTGPVITHCTAFACDDGPVDTYRAFVGVRLQDGAQLALDTLLPAKMGFIVGWAPERVAYIRRYKMKDGSTWTCPPIGDPNIDHPIGTLDQRVNVLRFDREGGDTVVLMNYGLHADTLNVDLISSDWPGWMQRTFETAVPGTKVAFFNGCEGDVGSTHVFPEGGDMNDTLISFDNEMKSPGMARFVGRALAGTILQVYDKVEYVDVDGLAVLWKNVRVAANVPDPADLPRAHEYKRLHEECGDEGIPYSAMELTTVVAEALRMCDLENGPDHFDLGLCGLAIGPVALVGIPGEPFTAIGVGIKEAEGWKCILPMCLTNGCEGYFPMKDAFDEGGYEARSSVFKGGVGEAIIDGGISLLNELREGRQ